MEQGDIDVEYTATILAGFGNWDLYEKESLVQHESIFEDMILPFL